MNCIFCKKDNKVVAKYRNSTSLFEPTNEFYFTGWYFCLNCSPDHKLVSNSNLFYYYPDGIYGYEYDFKIENNEFEYLMVNEFKDGKWIYVKSDYDLKITFDSFEDIKEILKNYILFG